MQLQNTLPCHYIKLKLYNIYSFNRINKEVNMSIIGRIKY